MYMVPFEINLGILWYHNIMSYTKEHIIKLSKNGKLI